MNEFERNGAVRARDAVDPSDWIDWIASVDVNRPGVRLNGRKGLNERIGRGSFPWALVARLLGDDAQPVRAILFDKSEDNNWPLGWHQDRTIAVLERHDVAGFGPWTVKAGIVHVEPPFELIERMVTVRIHLDDVSPTNAPLRIAPGSHRRGKILEADCAALLKTYGEVECPAEAGDIWIYSTPILHASDSAARPSRRRVVQVDYSAEALPEPLNWAGV